MPHFRFLSRKWAFAGDDLGTPATFGVATRAIWICAILPVFYQVASNPNSCLSSRESLEVYCVGALGNSALCATAYLNIRATARTGSPMETEKRSSLGSWILFLFTTMLLHLVWTVYGTLLLAYDAEKDCPDTRMVEILLIAVNIGSWVDLSVFAAVWLVMFGLSKRARDEPRDESDDLERNLLPASSSTGRETWNSRLQNGCCWCSYLTCGIFGTFNLTGSSGEEIFTNFNEVARAVAAWTDGLDLVLSDILAAAMLYRLVQFEEERKRTCVDSNGLKVKSHNQAFPSGKKAWTDPNALEALRLASKMNPYMLGVYGWKLNAWSDPLKLIPNWLGYVCNCSRARNRNVHRDCCACDTSILYHRIHSDVDTSAEILFARWKTFTAQSVPYTVCVDRVDKRVVVCCRGSMSVADFITDGMITPIPLVEAAKRWGFEDDIDPDTAYVHKGFMSVGETLREEIEEMGILNALFGLKGPKAQDVDPLEDPSEFELNVTGHSLGAGVATTLSLLLRPKFPNIKCLAYAPPGCLFDLKTTVRSTEWITSVWVGKDVAPILSWHSLIEQRKNFLEMLRRCKVTKSEALRAGVGKKSSRDFLYPEDEVPDSATTRKIASRLQKMAARKETLIDAIPLYAPGRLLHLAKTETRSTKSWCFWKRKQRSFVPYWVEDRLDLRSVRVSSRMVLDHFPDLGARSVDATLAEWEEFHDAMA